MVRGADNKNGLDIYLNRNNECRNSKTYSRMYERNSSGRKDNVRKENQEVDLKKDVRRASNRSRKYDDKDVFKKIIREKEKERSFEEINEEMKAKHVGDDREDYKPRPGKVKEIASKFNKNNSNYQQSKKERPKPLQSYGHQAYLDHIFPDAVEV